MTSLPRMLLAALLIATPAAHAADAAGGTASGTSPASLSHLELYDRPDASSPVRKLGVDHFSFPLGIEKVENGFAYVNHGEAKGWLRVSQLRMKRETAATGCIVVSGTPQRIGATPGMGEPCTPAAPR